MTKLMCTPLLLCALLVASPTMAADSLLIGPVRAVSFAGVSQWIPFGSGGWAGVVGSRVRFFGADSSERANVNLQGKEVLASAPGAMAVGVLVYADQQPSQLQAKQFALYDEQGHRRLSLDDPAFANAIVSPTGDAFVGLKGAEDFPQMQLQFYDGDGQLIDTHSVKSFEGGRFCADGSRFFFETASEGLQVVTAADGQLAHVIGPAESWGESADGRLIVTAGQGRLRFVRDGRPFGDLTWPDPQERLRAIAIAADGQRAAAISARHLALIRLDSLSYLWTRTTDSAVWNFRSVDLRPGGTAIAVGLDFDPGGQNPSRHQRSRCWLLDGSGTLTHVEESVPTSWGARYPQVRFLDGGRLLLFADRDGAKWISLSGR